VTNRDPIAWAAGYRHDSWLSFEASKATAASSAQLPVAVGTTIARRPPHRSGRAVLPHPAPTLGHDAKPVKRIRVTDVERRNPALDVAAHARPREAALTPSTERLPPEPTHCSRERVHRRVIHGHRVILHVPLYHRTYIRAEFRDGAVQAAPKFGFDRLQLGLHARPHRPPKHRELPGSGRGTDVREPEKIEARRFPLATGSPVVAGEPTKLQPPCLRGMQHQPEPRESFAQVREKLLGVVSTFEAHHEVVGKAHDDDVAGRVAPTPLVSPEVEDIVQVEIGQERASCSRPAPFLRH
jgi:hypothetical protein